MFIIISDSLFDLSVGAEKKKRKKDIKIHYSKNKIRMFLSMIKKTSYKFG